ncbi:uncharacterized protein KIAA1671 homolog isoform X2 [Rana temporaria]|uniref:uncharacterized protein KIAA1671 homolog isoform X2 n=1 Tax=Rana temporaria TaxID=8407 RepID=UPI001AACB82F|nr:uncharacterized protein KIAA1671 homolog isoform X2 [Rana temporaria]
MSWLELTTRNARSDIVNEGKSTRSYVSPLSDASNKSSESISSSLIFEETTRVPSKSVNMFNVGMKPRLSPKPFTREKPPETRRTVGLSALSAVMNSESDVPFPTSTSISLSDTKTEDHERVGRRIFTSKYQTDTEEDQLNKSDVFSSTVFSRKQTSSSWTSTDIGESKLTSQANEPKVTSKPPLMSKKTDVLQQQEKVHASSFRRPSADATDEQMEAVEKAKDNTFLSDSMDSLTVRAQLRPKRRPISMFLDPVSDQTPDSKITTDNKRPWNRRPLSEDLTSLFESGVLGNQKESPSEETKENRPLNKSSLNSSITEAQPDLASKGGDFSSAKNGSNETRTGRNRISSRNLFSERWTKDAITETRSSTEQEKNTATEVDSIMKRSVNNNKDQDSKALPDSNNDSSSEVKNADGSGIGIAAGITKRRISLYLANTSSSLDLPDSPTSKDKLAFTAERMTRAIGSDKRIELGRPQTASQYQPADVTKKFSTPSSNVEPRSEKTDEERNALTSQDVGVQKEKKDWRTSEFSEDKLQKPRRSFRKKETLPPQQNEDVFFERKSNLYKDKQFNNTTEEAEDKYKQPVRSDDTFRTVKATMFEHNVEWHSPPELLSGRNPTSSQIAKSDLLSENTEGKKDSGSWSKWLSDDSVHSVTQLHKGNDISGIRFSNSRAGKAESPAAHDILQNLKVDEKTRIEPRFEVIQAVGERVLSESIQMVPEDKAVTLRSQRSFHRKERELTNLELDESISRRPVSSLQRSKSEYRRRDTSSQESSTNKYASRDLDFSFVRNSLRAAKIDTVKAPEDRNYETSGNKSTVDATVSDFQPKSYKLDYKPKKENASEQCSTEQSLFGISATDGKDMKKSLNDFNRPAHRPSSDLVEKEFETGIRPVKVEPAGFNLNIREDTKKSSLIEEDKKESYQRTRFLSDKESPVTKKDNKDESNYLISEMLSNEVEQFKNDLTTHIAKDTNSFLRGQQFKEEYVEQSKLERKQAPFQDKTPSSSGKGNLLDLYSFEYEETKRKQSMSTLSPTESKATYFAITAIDNKKEKNDSNFESQNITPSSWTTDEFFKQDLKMSTTISGSVADSISYRSEAINTQGDFETSSAFKELKTHRNQRVLEDDSVAKPAKILEKKSVIDIDALIRKQKQKTSLAEKVSSSRDPKPEQKKSTPDLDTTESSPLNLDRSYKSKVVDIDSLMAEYNANPSKESISRDEDHNLPKWESSKSIMESTSKSSGSKWRDPSVKLVNNVENSPFETVASWYSSQTTTSTTESTKDAHTISNTADHVKSPKDAKYEQYQAKERDQGFQARSEGSQNIASFDFPQESLTRNLENYKAQSIRVSESPTVIADWSSSRTLAKTTVLEISVDKEDSAAAKLHHRVSVKTDRKSILTEERQPPSEGRRPAKASDLISLMLENKEKRREQHRVRQSIPVEHQFESTHRLKSQHEWQYSESKDYSEKESSRQNAKLHRVPESVMDLPRRKSLNRPRERDLKSDEDHVKQCFSRSSTSNKDTDSLVQDPDRQYGTWSQDKPQTEDSCVTDSPSYDNSSRKQHSHSRLSSLSHTETDQHDSITEARDGSLDRCSMDLDSIEGTESTPSEVRSADFSFIDQTSVLDSTALKNRVQLSRKSQRRAPSQLQRRSRLLQSSSQLAVIEDTDNLWMYSDTTEEKPEKKEEVVEEEEEKPKRSSVHSPRMPMFPGMDHSTLMAQLRKRQDAESSSESSPQVTKSPKSPLPHGTLGVKLLPTSADKLDKATGESPQWLKELKSKKRQSQYENHS